MGTGWSLAFFAAAAVLAASLATAALAGELCRLPVRRIAAVSTIAALLLICGEVLALFSLGRPELIFGILANPSTGLFRECVFCLPQWPLFSLLALSLQLAPFFGCLGAQDGIPQRWHCHC